MRISTNMIFNSGLARMNDAQASLLKTQQQLSSSKRILTPADDPVAAARVLNLEQSKALNEQYATNRTNAKNALAQEEIALQSATNAIHDIKELIVQAGNPAYDLEQRRYIAQTLQASYDELFSVANMRDGLGNYLFSGYQLNVQPFDKTAAGDVQYKGDQGQAMMQVDFARQVAIGDSGEMIFDNIKSNGTFISEAAVANTGTGVVSPLKVVDARNLTGHQYDIVFSAGGSTYSVYDLTLDPTKAGAPLATGAYASPQAITFDGLEVTVSGAPANGDMMTVRPNAKQSLFKTLKDVIELLNTQPTSPAGSANLGHGLAIANNNIDSALDNVLSVRSSVGARLKEIEVLDGSGESKNLQYESTISDLQDLDYNKAMSDLTKQQIILEASQKTFAKVSSLSLFDLI
jgi:flagellar hook-associated protein 3 FlgL